MANIVIQTFIQGGPIMWPLLVTSIVAVAVVLERILWWKGLQRRRDPERKEKIFAALRRGELAVASSLSRSSEDPAIRMIWQGISTNRSRARCRWRRSRRSSAPSASTR